MARRPCVNFAALPCVASLTVLALGQAADAGSDCVRNSFSELLPPSGLAVPFVDGPTVEVVRANGELHGFRGDGYLNGTNYWGMRPFGSQGPEVVRIAGARYERSWGEFKDWMDQLGNIAEEYKDRSEYFAIRVGDASFWDRNNAPTTIGLTYSKFTKEDIVGKTASEIISNPKIRLPQERTTGLPVKRYFDSRGRGIAIEFRTNSKELGSPDYLRNQMNVEMVRMAFEQIKDYPELYDKPIIYAYADRAHLRLYQKQYGMTVQTEITPLDRPFVITNENGKKLEWWVIATTPRQWEANLMKLKGERSLSGLNQPYPFEDYYGHRLNAAPHSRVAFNDANGIIDATLNEGAEIEPGLKLKKGTRVGWFDRRVAELSGATLEEPFRIAVPGGELEIPAHKEFTLFFDSDRNHLPEVQQREVRMHRPGHDIGVDPGSILRDDRGNPLARSLRFAGPGANIKLPHSEIVGMGDFGIEIDPAEQTVKLGRLAKEVRFGELAADPGHGVTVQWKGDHYEWRELVLVEPATIDGERYEKGARLRRDSTGRLQK